ncbi:MAG: hypothetical protein WCK00_07880, partial [Deltaproteobacteria bacterium]
IFSHLDSVSSKFLGFSLHHLGYISMDDAVPKSISRQELVVLAEPMSRVAKNFKRIAEIVQSW